jgi:L-2-hydroxycarboxylate dehydrogenase (NAD+)
MTIANPLVAPTHSVSQMLGTNPIAVAVPAGKHPPFVADFSTTPIARGKLAVAAKKGEKVPLGYVQMRMGSLQTIRTFSSMAAPCSPWAVPANREVTRVTA